jgi:hypothetical protein
MRLPPRKLMMRLPLRTPLLSKPLLSLLSKPLLSLPRKTTRPPRKLLLRRLPR